MALVVAYRKGLGAPATAILAVAIAVIAVGAHGWSHLPPPVSCPQPYSVRINQNTHITTVTVLLVRGGLYIQAETGQSGPAWPQAGPSSANVADTAADADRGVARRGDVTQADTGDSVFHVSVSNGMDDGRCGSPSYPCLSLGHVLRARAAATVSGRVIAVMAAGRFDALSCGIVTTTPLTVVGNGSSSTIVDCQHRSRMILSTSLYLVVRGLTITNGVELPVFGASGGGAISIEWLMVKVSGAIARFEDVHFVKNGVEVISDSGFPAAPFGGGALSIVATAQSTASNLSIWVVDCAFTGNTVLGSPRLDPAMPSGGGGLFVSVASNGDVDNAIVAVTRSTFSTNLAEQGVRSTWYRLLVFCTAPSHGLNWSCSLVPLGVVCSVGGWRCPRGYHLRREHH